MGRIRQGIRAPLAWPASQSEIRIRRALADLGILG
jgi:hypothetical protein